MGTAAEDLMSLIEDAGIAVYGDTLFLSTHADLPAGDGPLISLIEVGGSGPEGTHNSLDTPAYVRPGFQIVCRGADYDAVRAAAQSVYDLFFPVRNRTINGTFWRQITIVQEPFDALPDDDAGRVRVVFNIDCVKRPSPATS